MVHVLEGLEAHAVLWALCTPFKGALGGALAPAVAELSIAPSGGIWPAAAPRGDAPSAVSAGANGVPPKPRENLRCAAEGGALYSMGGRCRGGGGTMHSTPEGGGGGRGGDGAGGGPDFLAAVALAGETDGARGVSEEAEV